MFSTKTFFLPIPKLQCHKQIKNTLKLTIKKIKFQHLCKAHKIALLSGDGIGPEISEVTVSLLKTAASITGEEFEIQETEFGGQAIDKHGIPFPDKTKEICKNSDAVLLAAIGGNKWDMLSAEKRPEKGLLQLRSELGAFANLRPAKVFPQLIEASCLKSEIIKDCDMLIVRELVGGIYFGKPRGIKENEKGERVGINTMTYSESEIERIAHVAFKAAMERRKKVCSIDKANVLEVSQLWREVVEKVSKSYPKIELTHFYIDNAAMQLVKNPKIFDTVVTSNIFGDILSDEAAIITGSLGMLPSASISDKGPGIYEPIHGSAPDIAGKDLANPMAMVLSAAMMCKYGLNLPNISDMLEKAIFDVLEKGYRTRDLATSGTIEVNCSEMGNLLNKELESNAVVKQ